MVVNLRMHSQKFLDLLPANITVVTNEDYIWPHNAIQRELDHILTKAHDDRYDLINQNWRPARQSHTFLHRYINLCTHPSKSGLLRIPNEHLIYLAKQLFGKPQRTSFSKFCLNTSSTGTFCGASMDSRDLLHMHTCKMTSIHHQNYAAIQHLFEDLAR
jgi:hypothetical protein